MNSPVKIFIIYAHEDAVYKDGLIKALSPLKNQGWVKSWHDGDIRPGEVWDEQIRQNLNAADVVVPLVSSDFFASEYIQQVEIHHAFPPRLVFPPRFVPAVRWLPLVAATKQRVTSTFPPRLVFSPSTPTQDAKRQALASLCENTKQSREYRLSP